MTTVEQRKAAICDLLAANPGMRSLQISSALGLTPDQAKHPLRYLAESGRVGFVRMVGVIVWGLARDMPALRVQSEAAAAAVREDRKRRKAEFDRQPHVRERRNAQERANKRKRIRAKQAESRYHWPAETSYQPPARPVRSVWELAACQ